MSIRERLVTKVMKATGYRFPKHEGWFRRESKSRQLLRSVGIRVVLCNLNADLGTALKGL